MEHKIKVAYLTPLAIAGRSNCVIQYDRLVAWTYEAAEACHARGIRVVATAELDRQKGAKEWGY